MSINNWKYYEIFRYFISDKKGIIGVVFAPNLDTAESVARIYCTRKGLTYYQRGDRKRRYSDVRVNLSKNQQKGQITIKL